MTMRRPSPSPARSSPSAAPEQAADSQGAVPIPKTNRNPVWSLCPWPVVVSLPGIELEIPAMPAVNWLQYLMDPDGPDITGLVLDLMPEVEEFFLGGDDFDTDGLLEIAYDVISTVGARHWWQVVSLSMMAVHSWDALGPLLIKNGGDPNTLSLAAWLDVVIATVIENLDKPKAMMFALQLEMPPPSEDGSPAELPAADRNEFFAMAAD